MILASDIIKTILVKSYKEISCILWDFKIYAWGCCWGWGWGSGGAHWGITAAAAAACGYVCSLNQIYGTQRCGGILPLWINSAIMPKFATFLSCMCSLFEKVLTYTPVGVLVDNKILKILKSCLP